MIEERWWMGDWLMEGKLWRPGIYIGQGQALKLWHRPAGSFLVGSFSHSLFSHRISKNESAGNRRHATVSNGRYGWANRHAPRSTGDEKKPFIAASWYRNKCLYINRHLPSILSSLDDNDYWLNLLFTAWLLCFHFGTTVMLENLRFRSSFGYIFSTV